MASSSACVGPCPTKMSQRGQTCHTSVEGQLLFSHSPELEAVASPQRLLSPVSPGSMSQQGLWIFDTKCHSVSVPAIAFRPVHKCLTACLTILLTSHQCSAPE